MADQLTATTNAGGGQTTTQNPQTATQNDASAAGAERVQPGTADRLLTSQQGVSLVPGNLTTVDLSARATTVAAPRPVTPLQHKGINQMLLGTSVALCIVAVALFWWMTRSAKSTTLSP